MLEIYYFQKAQEIAHLKKEIDAEGVIVLRMNKIKWLDLHRVRS